MGESDRKGQLGVNEQRVKAAPGQVRGPARVIDSEGRRIGSIGAGWSTGRRVAAVLATGALVALMGCSTPIHGAAPKGRSTGLPFTAQSVGALYGQDLVARVNAERAARSSPSAPIPDLQVDPGLEAEAEAWSSQIASSGTVADPTLPPCTGGNQVCALAANSGNSGYGFWPGDGSDGMDGDYMLSAAHRQNELGAAYTSIGVGVTCSADQAWTVEIFGYSPSILPSANARASAQNAVDGDPVAQNPIMAGTPSGDPVYCPGQTDGPNGQISVAGGQVPYPYSVPGVPGEPGNGVASVVGIASTPDSGGYWLARSDGSIATHGDAVSYGSMAGANLDAPTQHIVSTADGKGYWLVASDGGTFAFGDAGFFGSMGGRQLNAPVVDLAPTADGKGYWLVASDGGIFAFGDARFHGSMGGQPLRAPVVAIAPDDATGGYWLVGTDGGIFAFDAPFVGSTGGLVLNQPVNGMAATADGHGYWLVASDGAIFAFGDAPFHGSTGGMTLNAPVVGMTADAATGGYWLVGSDGGVFSFNAPFFGSG